MPSLIGHFNACSLKIVTHRQTETQIQTHTNQVPNPRCTCVLRVNDYKNHIPILCPFLFSIPKIMQICRILKIHLPASRGGSFSRSNGLHFSGVALREH